LFQRKKLLLFFVFRIITKTGMQNLIQHSMASMIPTLKNGGSKPDNAANQQIQSPGFTPTRSATGEQVV
jgi:hypothetical protein